jgi:hypothetical protein
MLNIYRGISFHVCAQIRVCVSIFVIGPISHCTCTVMVVQLIIAAPQLLPIGCVGQFGTIHTMYL